MRTILAFLLAYLASTTSAAYAVPISVYNTGVDAGGVPLPGGTIGDPHYGLIAVPSGTTQIRVISSIWPGVPDNSTSRWITSNQQSWAAGNFVYRTTFELPMDGSVQFSGQWATDNGGLDILVNGVSTGSVNTTQFLAWTEFDIFGEGLAGLNTLDFVVNNSIGSFPNPTGLRVEFFSATFTPVPEPSSLILATLAGLGLLLAGRRRWLGVSPAPVEPCR